MVTLCLEPARWLEAATLLLGGVTPAGLADMRV